MFGFGGIVSLKNNRRERVNKFERLEKYLGYDYNSKPEYKTASKDKIQRFRERVLEQQKALQRRRWVIFVIIFTIVLSCLVIMLQ